ncbi:hypothetical protein [Hypnocyclicus thermotrophus]|nr:hypothetical protein [Hypnocyclicus thermotrophus]
MEVNFLNYEKIEKSYKGSSKWIRRFLKRGRCFKDLRKEEVNKIGS